jgi:Rieske Fe-S protein
MGILAPAAVLEAAAKGKSKIYKAELTDNNEVIIPAALFAEETLQIVRVKGWDYDMAVQKKEDASYTVLLMRCTHMDNELKQSGEGFSCSLHGSSYDMDGKVTKGPAEKPMEQYHAILKEDNIIITP